MNSNPSRYRVLASINTNTHHCGETGTREFISKSNTIFQCDTLNDALDQIKVISENNPECTKFEIERGEWL